MNVARLARIRVSLLILLGSVLAPTAMAAGSGAESRSPSAPPTTEQVVRVDEVGLRFSLPGAWEERLRLHVPPMAPVEGSPDPVRLSEGRVRLGNDDLRIQVDYVRFDAKEPLAGTRLFFDSLRRRHTESRVLNRPGLDLLPFTSVASDVGADASLFWSLSPETFEKARSSPELVGALVHFAMVVGASGSSTGTLDLRLRCRGLKPVLELTHRNPKPAPFSGVRALAFTNGSVEGMITARAVGPDQNTVRRKLSELDALFTTIEATLTVESAGQ